MVTKQLCQTLLSKQFVLMLFSDYSLTKKKHSNFKQTEQDKLKKDKKTHRAHSGLKTGIKRPLA